MPILAGSKSERQPIAWHIPRIYDNGWVKSRTGPDGQTTSYDYWPDGQVKHVTDALGNVTYYEYDPAGHQSLVQDALLHSTQFHYDPLGRLAQTVFQDGSSTSNVFNNVGQRIGQVDQATCLVSFGYDVAGQFTGVTNALVSDPENNNQPVRPVWQYSYALYGRLTVTTDAKGRTNVLTYDAVGRQVTRRLPLGQTDTNVYNGLGQLWKKVDCKGQRTEFKYDELGRLRGKFYFAAGDNNPTEGVAYRYNWLGQLQQIIELRGDAVMTNTADGYPYLAALGGGAGRRRRSAGFQPA
jgi:YD repeat-containing protein